jgi:hypothetical protein
MLFVFVPNVDAVLKKLPRDTTRTMSICGEHNTVLILDGQHGRSRNNRVTVDRNIRQTRLKNSRWRDLCADKM